MHGSYKNKWEKSRERQNLKQQPFFRCQEEEKTDKTYENRTNMRKVLNLSLFSPGEVIAVLKGLKNTKHDNKITQRKT